MARVPNRPVGASSGGRTRRTEKVSEVVAREIVQLIVSEELQPGAMLPSESVMLEEYGVGRASLREALRILEVYGLITIRPGPGGGPRVGGVDSENFGRMATFYLQVSRATIREVVEARLVMEPVMARLVAGRKDDPEVRARIQATLKDMANAIGDVNHDDYLHASTDFHSMIASMSGNVILDLFADALRSIFLARVSSLQLDEAERNRVAKDHDAVSAAILRGDGAKAEKLMREHMVRYRDRVAEIFPGVMDEVVDWR